MGGSGYLGLHILQSLALEGSRFCTVFTYFSDPPLPSPDMCTAQAFKVDLRSGQGFSSISEHLGLVSTHQYVYICFLGIVSQLMFSEKDVFSLTMDLITSMLAINHTLMESIVPKRAN